LREVVFPLRDGRRIGGAEYGAAGGDLVFFFPGTPGSRFRHPPEPPSLQRGARILVLERPGFGLSDYQPRRQLLDWPADVQEIAAQLGLKRFRVVGVSGGGPYALACAYRLGDRLQAAAVVSGVGPTDKPGGLRGMPRVRQLAAWLARHAPGILELLLRRAGNPHRDPEGFYRKMLAGNDPQDQAFLSRPEVKQEMMRNYLEATRQGVQGLAREGVIVSRPWGFRLAGITAPVSLWHGEADRNVSLAAARTMAEAIPGCRAHFLPGQGHMLLWECWDQILAELMAL